MYEDTASSFSCSFSVGVFKVVFFGRSCFGAKIPFLGGLVDFELFLGFWSFWGHSRSFFGQNR